MIPRLSAGASPGRLGHRPHRPAAKQDRVDADSPGRVRRRITDVLPELVEQVRHDLDANATVVVLTGVLCLTTVPVLHVRVRDGSSALPVLAPEGAASGVGGRGLRLVDLYASGWGGGGAAARGLVAAT